MSTSQLGKLVPDGKTHMGERPLGRAPTWESADLGERPLGRAPTWETAHSGERPLGRGDQMGKLAHLGKMNPDGKKKTGIGEMNPDGKK